MRWRSEIFDLIHSGFFISFDWAIHFISTWGSIHIISPRGSRSFQRLLGPFFTSFHNRGLYTMGCFIFCLHMLYWRWLWEMSFMNIFGVLFVGGGRWFIWSLNWGRWFVWSLNWGMMYVWCYIWGSWHVRWGRCYVRRGRCYVTRWCSNRCFYISYERWRRLYTCLSFNWIRAWDFTRNSYPRFPTEFLSDFRECWLARLSFRWTLR